MIARVVAGPRRVEQTGAWNAHGLGDAASPDRDMGATDTDTQARPGPAEVHRDAREKTHAPVEPEPHTEIIRACDPRVILTKSVQRMVAFRCTRKLLDRLPHPVEAAPTRSTTALGDWYFNLLIAKPQWLLLGVSETSRLPVVLPARELHTMTVRFQQALVDILEDLGVSAAAIAAERAAMKDIAIAKTVDRHVIGSLNEFMFGLRFALEDRVDKSPHELSLWLAQTPILPLKDFPDRMARRLLEQRTRH